MTARVTADAQPRVVFGWFGALVSIALAMLFAVAAIAITQPRKPAPAQATAPQQHLAKVAR